MEDINLGIIYDEISTGANIEQKEIRRVKKTPKTERNIS